MTRQKTVVTATSNDLPVTTLVVSDPHYKGRVLVSHEGLSATDALELTQIYQNLGYPAVCIIVTTPAALEEAA